MKKKLLFLAIVFLVGCEKKPDFLKDTWIDKTVIPNVGEIKKVEQKEKAYSVEYNEISFEEYKNYINELKTYGYVYSTSTGETENIELKSGKYTWVAKSNKMSVLAEYNDETKSMILMVFEFTGEK